MRLYLMQHGQCLPEALDEQQPLSPVGREEAETTAMAADRMGISFTDIFTSPKKRAAQTARIMARFTGFPEDDIVQDDDFKAMVAPERTIRRLVSEGFDSSVLVCGHLPNLNRLACQLLTSGPEFTIAVKNAGLICLSMERLPTASAKLEWYLRPEHLASIAK